MIVSLLGRDYLESNPRAKKYRIEKWVVKIEPRNLKESYPTDCDMTFAMDYCLPTTQQCRVRISAQWLTFTFRLRLLGEAWHIWHPFLHLQTTFMEDHGSSSLYDTSMTSRGLVSTRTKTPGNDTQLRCVVLEMILRKFSACRYYAASFDWLRGFCFRKPVAG